MGKRDQPYNIIKEAVLKVQSDIVEIKSDIDEIKNKPTQKSKKKWVILSISGTVIIFLSSLIQNLLVTKLDSEISNGSTFANVMDDFDTKLSGFKTQVQQNQVAYNANKNELGLHVNLCNSYASYCTIASNMERAFFEWLPIGTKLPQNVKVDFEFKRKRIEEVEKFNKKISEFNYKFLIDSLEKNYTAAQLSYYANNEKFATLCGQILNEKENRRTKIKDYYTFFLLLGGLLAVIASFKNIYQ